MKLPRLSTLDRLWTEPEPAPIAATFRPPPRASTPIEVIEMFDADLIEEPPAFPRATGSVPRLVVPLPGLPPWNDRRAQRDDHDATQFVRGGSVLKFPTRRSRSTAIVVASAACCVAVAIAVFSLSSPSPQARVDVPRPAAAQQAPVPAAAPHAAATKPTVMRRPIAGAPAKRAHAKKAHSPMAH